MSQSVIVSEDLLNLIREEAELQGRTISEQLAHWLNIGRAIEKSTEFDFVRVLAAISGKLETNELTAAEDAVWKVLFTERMTHGVEGEDDYYAKKAEKTKIE